MTKPRKAPKRPNVHQLYISDESWNKAKPILKPVGLSRSQFVELIFQALVDSEVKPLAEVQGNLFQGMIQGVVRQKSMTKKQKS